MKIAGVQTDLVWESPADNFARLAGRIAAAAAAGARLVALPEMFPTGFSMAAARIAEDADGPACQWLLSQAKACGVTVCGSVATRVAGGGKPRNLGLVAHPDGRVERYAKIHPFTFGGEPEQYASGDATLTFEQDGVRVSLLICYDLRFGELFARLAARTDLFVVLANWPEPRRDHWRTLLKARSIDTQAYVLGVNRVGTGNALSYLGDSALWAPGGELIAEAAPGQEQTISGEVDPARVATLRRAFPMLNDRRPDLYARV